ncbi:MAG: homoprotocatechuate degradation operon regulator HpaR [Burkholderiales bacterium]|nr:MAG: homoprotocatechuate degradation operon regulator HpaR [Burkholderiales bacterium]
MGRTRKQVGEPAPGDDGTRPRQIRRSLPITLLRAREAVMARFRPMLAEHGVTDQQWRAIRVLGEAGPLDATELSERCCILTQSMTRIIRALEDRDLVVRSRDSSDGRRLVIALTPAARALLKRITPKSREIYRELEVRYGAERIDLLLDMLDELARTRP